ncbi:MAG TPA: xanthine dehydrogenase family protein subunit M [Burkholderiales bacterium]
MKGFAYSSARTLDEAVGLLGPKVRALAGGTDLLTLMKADLQHPERLVDIKRLAGLSRHVEGHGDGLVIGALATLSEIAAHEAIRTRYRALAQSAEAAATPQLRNMATAAGNLLQRPRCWYFRNARIDCWLKGGADCPARAGENREHALFGGTPCVAVHPSDPANALLAFDADVRLVGRGGERSVSLQDFLHLPSESRRVETSLSDDELVAAIRLPPHPDETRSVYLKAMDRRTWGFALVSVAAVLRLSGPRIAHARLVLGGVAPIPWPARAAEAVLIGHDAEPALLDQAADLALAGAQPLSHNGYKIPLARALVRRALGELAGRR